MSRAEAIEAAKRLIGFDELLAPLALNQFAELTQLAPKTCRNRVSLGLEPKPIVYLDRPPRATRVGGRLVFDREEVISWLQGEG